MNRPPYLMRLRITNPEHKINLWLPLFIILPFVAIILIVLLPLVLLAALVLWPFGWGRLLLVIPAVLTIICAIRGLEVEVEDKSERVLISVK
ncbi:hypothetical protein ACFLYN_06300 [Chloroflexota bacterium]